MSLGDFDTSAVVYGKFTTYRPSTGAPYTLAGTPALSVYKDNSTTQSTTGVTLTADFDTVTGFNHFAIDTSADGTFYAAGSFFDIVITTGTVDSVSAVGTVVGRFTLRKDSSLKPTTAGRTLDVSAGGEAGVDWANIGSPTTSNALTGTTIAVTQKVDVDTIKTNPVVNGGTITFPTAATLASTTNITAGTISTVTNLTNAPTAGDLTATMKTSVTTAATAATPTAAAVTGAVGSVTAPVTVGTNSDKTGYALTAAYDPAKTAAQAGDAMALTSAYDFAKGTVAMTEGYATDGSTATPSQMMYMLWSLMAEKSISGTTMTSKKLDGSTSAMTFTLNSATAPTSVTRAT